MLKATDFRRIARESLKGNWLVAVAAGFIAALLGGGIMGTGGANLEFDGAEIEQHMRSIALDPSIVNIIMAALGVVSLFAVLYAIIMLVIGGAVSLGYARFNLNLVNRNNPKIEDVFSEIRRFGAAFAMRFCTALFTLLWSLLFIIPGIVAIYSYSMAPYILMENPDMTGMQAIKASKELMKGNRWRLFCLSFSFIGWNILCGFTLGIGNLFLRPYREAATAAFYREIKWEKMKQQAGME